MTKYHNPKTKKTVEAKSLKEAVAKMAKKPVKRKPVVEKKEEE